MSEHYRKMRSEFRLTMNAVFYNSTMGAWYDYNMRTRSHNVEFYPSIAVPLFTGCYQGLDQWKSVQLFRNMQVRISLLFH
jgi:alpha,alpha-trehalase